MRGTEVFTYTELSDFLANLIEEKAIEVQTRAEKILEEEAQVAKVQVVRDTPVSRFKREHLKDTFKTEVQFKKVKDGQNTELRKKYVIFSEKKYQVLHFVELGFNHYKSKQFIKGKHFVYKAKLDASERITSRLKLMLNDLKNKGGN